MERLAQANYKQMAVVAVDEAGHLKAVQRENGASMFRTDVATSKDMLMVGTDQPFNFHHRTPGERIEAADFDADTLARIVRRNAEGFLGLDLKE